MKVHGLAHFEEPKLVHNPISSRRLWCRIHVHKLRSKLRREFLRVNGSHLVHWATVARSAAVVDLSHAFGGLPNTGAISQ